MPEKVAGINPAVLKWARERSGHSVEDVAKTFKKDAEVVKSWESGASAPTYLQLETLAYRLYKRPVAIFFFPEPPDEPDPKQSFRTLPDFEIENMLPDTRYALRQAQAMQLALNELNDGFNPSEQKIFREIKISEATNVTLAATTVRDYLGVALKEQTNWPNTEKALANWRKVIQDNGVFVFKRSLKQKDISGFCALGEEFPVIYLNNSTPDTRQIFSLFHELPHLLLGTNGVTKRDDNYINSLTGSAKRIEFFCNRFANEFLVPSDDFEQWLGRDFSNDEVIERIARNYKVSREVILRKVLDRKIIDRQYYDKKVKDWYAQPKKTPGGGDYYANQATYLGEKFLDLAFRRYYQGRCSFEELADYLNVKVRSVAGLEEFFLRKAPS